MNTHRARKDIEEEDRASKARSIDLLSATRARLQLEVLLDCRDLLTDIFAAVSPAKPKTYTLEELIAMQPPKVQEKIREEYEALKRVGLLDEWRKIHGDREFTADDARNQM